MLILRAEETVMRGEIFFIRIVECRYLDKTEKPQRPIDKPRVVIVSEVIDTVTVNHVTNAVYRKLKLDFDRINIHVKHVFKSILYLTRHERELLSTALTGAVGEALFEQS